MTAPPPPLRYRFGIFEADPITGELRRQGIRVKLNAQPFQVLLLLLERPGQLLTREEIARSLWPDGTFVDYDHGLNSTINRIREALGDTAANPRFIETLARRGYRFLAAVEKIVEPVPLAAHPAPKPSTEPSSPESASYVTLKPSITLLAAPQDLPQASHTLVHTLFVLLQLMYLGFYIGALASLTEISNLLSPLPHAPQVLTTLIVTAAILIPVRAFLLTAMLFHAPSLRWQFLRIWPFLLLFDILWALSPFLLLHHISVGLALSCTPLLVYSPFAQRSLILMGAADPIPAL